METIVINQNPPTPNEALFEECYEALLPKFKALKPEELIPINLDIPAAVSTALGVAPELSALKDRVAEELPKFDFDPILHLDTYAMALSHAHTLFLVASQPPDELKSLVDEGTVLRETLLADATALVKRRLINGNQLRDLEGPVGYKHLAVDLQMLAALFREHLEEVKGKCATSAADIHRAEQIAAEILRTVGLREQGPASVAATADMRARAYTAFMRVYDQARRIVGYLRWDEDDASTITPSFFPGRGGNHKKPDAPAPANGATGPFAPAPTPGSQGAPGASPALATHVAAPAQHPAVPGTPSAEPFVS